MKNNCTLSNIKGLTLIEVIVTLAILAIIIAPISYIYYDSQREYIAEIRKINAQSEINKAMNMILEDLRKVEGPEVSGGIPSIEIVDNILVARYSSIKQVAYKLNANELYRYKDGQIQRNVDPVTKKVTITLIGVGEKVIGKVTYFEVTSDIDNPYAYKIEIKVKPDDVGNKKISEISLVNRFIPRFYIN